MNNTQSETRTVRRVLRLGKVDYNRSGRRNCMVTLEVELKYGPNNVAPYLDIDLNPCRERVEFSMSGNIWNPRETDIYSGGQMCEDIAAMFPNNKRVQRLVEIWKRYHLNGMKAGCRAQEDFLRAHPVEAKYPKSYYEEACKALEAAGLLEVTGGPEVKNANGLRVRRSYKYGTAWLAEQLPSEIELEIRTLTA